MKTTLQLTLVQPARKSGGDKYETETEEAIAPFHIYLPQAITRVGGQPILNFTMILEPKEGI